MLRGSLSVLLAALLVAGCASQPPRPSSGHVAAHAPEFVALHALLGNSETAPATALDEDYRTLSGAYALQPDFPCRQPAWAVYFRQQGQPSATPTMNCPDVLPLQMRDSLSGWQLRWLDPQRVRAIHLLFAGKSPAMASRFGHVALRLIVCPDRESAQALSAAACDLQVEDQLVLGFQAYVDDSQISLRRAVFGGYRARLVAQPFMYVYGQYTSAEFRDVYSLPLRMTSQEQGDFLRALVQLHWSHESDYRFFSGNCATLLQETLAAFWPRYRQSAALKASFIRPDHFFLAMQKSGLLDTTSLQDQRRARRDGYFFASNETAYREAAQMLAAAMQHPFFTQLDDYLVVPVAARRETMARDAGLAAALAGNSRLQEATLLLEEWAMLQAERRVLRASQALWEMKKGRLRYKGDMALSPPEEALMDECLLRPLQALFSPPGLQGGIPMAARAEAALPVACEAAQKSRFQQMLKKELQHASPDWQQLMMAISELAETVVRVQALRQTTMVDRIHGGNGSDII